jgi:hypothetical protein
LREEGDRGGGVEGGGRLHNMSLQFILDPPEVGGGDELVDGVEVLVELLAGYPDGEVQHEQQVDLQAIDSLESEVGEDVGKLIVGESEVIPSLAGQHESREETVAPIPTTDSEFRICRESHSLQINECDDHAFVVHPCLVVNGLHDVFDSFDGAILEGEVRIGGGVTGRRQTRT